MLCYGFFHQLRLSLVIPIGGTDDHIKAFRICIVYHPLQGIFDCLMYQLAVPRLHQIRLKALGQRLAVIYQNVLRIVQIHIKRNQRHILVWCICNIWRLLCLP